MPTPTSVIASARKSKGEYKPLLKFPGGKTTVLQQNPERFTTYTRHGAIKGNRYARGTTYATREEAIAAAQAHIDERLADAIARRQRTADSKLPAEKMARFLQHHDAEVALWGGSVQ